MVTNKPNLLFSKAFSSADHIEYGGHVTELFSEDKDLDPYDIVSFYDFKNRRVVLYGTNFGNIASIEEKTSNRYDYFVLYNRNSPIQHLLPFRSITDRDLSYIHGDKEENIPNIIERIDGLISNIQEFFVE